MPANRFDDDEDDVRAQTEIEVDQPEAAENETSDTEETGQHGDPREDDSTEDAPGESGEEEAPYGGEDLRPRRRGDERIARLANETRRLRQELEEERRQRAAVQTQQTHQPREETPQEFEARLLNMNPDERVLARLERTERLTQRQINALHQSTLDANDKASFGTLYTPKVLKKFGVTRDEVETELQRARQAGMNPSREAVLDHLYMKRARKVMLEGDTEKDRRAAERRVRSQQTRPSDNRGDAGTRERTTRQAGGTDREQRRKRLEGQRI